MHNPRLISSVILPTEETDEYSFSQNIDGQADKNQDISFKD
jgi:hypothetical protein